MQTHDGRVVAVTGAGSGNGRAIAETLLAGVVNVALLDMPGACWRTGTRGGEDLGDSEHHGDGGLYRDLQQRVSAGTLRRLEAGAVAVAAGSGGGVYPGPSASERQVGQSEDVGNGVSSLSSDKAGRVTGGSLLVDGGWMAY